MKRLVKRLVLKSIVRTLGFATRNVDAIRIFTYHSIHDYPNRREHIRPDCFEEHVRYFADRGYRSLRIVDIADQWPVVLDERPAVALTFDDGLCNNWTIACRILDKYHMTGTFFVPTSFIGEDRRVVSAASMAPYNNNEMLSWSDLRAMLESGYEIGSHSHTHIMMAKQSPEQAETEITQSKLILEEKLGVTIKSFAYPKGHSNSYAEWTKHLLRSAGYAAACTQSGGPLRPDSDLLELPRLGMSDSDTFSELVLKCHGHYDCLRWLRRYK